MKGRDGGEKHLSVCQRKGNDDFQGVVTAAAEGSWQQIEQGGKRERRKGRIEGKIEERKKRTGGGRLPDARLWSTAGQVGGGRVGERERKGKKGLTG